jgi:predicted RNA-binding protein
MYESKKKIFKPHPIGDQNEIYPLRINLNLITPSILEYNIREILEEISFIIKKKNWPAYFFRTIIRISREDYLVIKRNMNTTNL